MWRYRLIILFIFLHLRTNAQEGAEAGKISSLNDTAFINKMMASARKIRHEYPDSCMQLYQTAFILSKERGFIEGIAKSLTGLGLSYMDKGEYDKSLFTYKLAKPYCIEASRTNKRALAVLYNNLAALYGNKGIADSAIFYYYKSLEEIKAKGITDTTLLTLLYSNLGGKLALLGQYKQANYYIQKGELIARATHNDLMLGKLFLDRSVIYGAEKKYDSLRIFSFKALELFKNHPDPASQVSANYNIAHSYLQEKKTAEAEKYYLAALSPNINASPTQRAPAYIGLGEYYLSTKQYQKAEKNFLKMLEIAKEANMLKGVGTSYKNLVEVYTQLGDYKQAQYYRNEFDKIKDSTENADKLKLMADWEARYRIAEKDKDIVEKQLLIEQKENELQQKNTLLGFIIAVAALIPALIISVYRIRKHKEDLKMMKREKEREVNQLKATMKGEEKERTRIARELHDGIMVRFSTVQMNLSALIENEKSCKPEKLEVILSQLEEATKELRKSAHNLMPDMLLQEGLAEAAHYFCKTLQSSCNIDIDFQLYGAVPPIAAEYELMAYRMIQELLQNVIKHAKAKSVLVQINGQPHMISIAVEDDGTGFDNNKHKPFSGMGLRSIEDRVHSLHGNMSVNTAQGRGTSIYIELDTQYLQANNHEVRTYQSSHS